MFPVDGGVGGRMGSLAERPAGLGDYPGVVGRVYEWVIGLEVFAGEDVADGFGSEGCEGFRGWGGRFRGGWGRVGGGGWAQASMARVERAAASMRGAALDTVKAMGRLVRRPCWLSVVREGRGLGSGPRGLFVLCQPTGRCRVRGARRRCFQRRRPSALQARSP